MKHWHTFESCMPHNICSRCVISRTPPSPSHPAGPACPCVLVDSLLARLLRDFFLKKEYDRGKTLRVLWKKKHSTTLVINSQRRRFQADMLIGTYQLVLGDIVPVECFAKVTLPIEDNARKRNQYKMQIRLVPSRPANIISPGSHAAWVINCIPCSGRFLSPLSLMHAAS